MPRTEIAIVSCSVPLISKASTLLSASGRRHLIFDETADILQFLQETQKYKVIFLDTNTFEKDLSAIFHTAKEYGARIYSLQADGIPSPMKRLA